MLLHALKDSYKLFTPFIKNNIVLLGILFLGCEVMQHYFLIVMQATKEVQSFNFVAIMGQMTTSLLEFVVLTILVPLRIIEAQSLTKFNQESFISFSQRHMMALTTESLRSLAVVLMWSLLLIIPGLFKYLRYSFVPYVVVADAEYQNGKRDALEYSNALVKGYTLQIFVIFAILLAQESARGWARENFSIVHWPIEALIIGVIFFMMNVFANILLFRIYQLRVAVLELREKGASNGT